MGLQRDVKSNSFGQDATNGQEPKRHHQRDDDAGNRDEEKLKPVSIQGIEYPVQPRPYRGEPLSLSRQIHRREKETE
jgi:hypothetical protein